MFTHQKTPPKNLSQSLVAFKNAFSPTIPVPLTPCDSVVGLLNIQFNYIHNSVIFCLHHEDHNIYILTVYHAYNKEMSLQLLQDCDCIYYID